MKLKEDMYHGVLVDQSSSLMGRLANQHSSRSPYGTKRSSDRLFYVLKTDSSLLVYRKHSTSALTPPPSPPFLEVAGTHVGLSIDPTLPPIPPTSTLTLEKLPSPSLTPPLSIRNRRTPSSSSRASIRSVSASSFSNGSRNFQPGTMKSAAPVLSAAGEDSFTKYSNEDWSAASSAVPRARTFSASTGRESKEPVIIEAPTRSKGPAVLRKKRSAGTLKGKEKEAVTVRIVSAGDRLKGLLDSSNRK